MMFSWSGRESTQRSLAVKSDPPGNTGQSLLREMTVRTRVVPGC